MFLELLTGNFLVTYIYRLKSRSSVSDIMEMAGFDGIQSGAGRIWVTLVMDISSAIDSK